jgi:mannose-6-phosphate isomerase
MDLLENPVRDYPWGSAGDIPEFLGVPAGGGPVAELWMGAHPDSPSRVLRGGQPRSLAEVIAADPEAELGSRVRDAFGPRLPFLLKLISAARPLSLQVHPDRQHARRAYAAQQAAPGADRDYTDDNHKPELVCALRDGFAGLCGFRPLAGTADLLAALAVPGLTGFASRLDPADPAGSLRALVTDTLTGPADPALIAAVRAACERAAGVPGRWAAACAAYAVVAAAYPADPGVLVALLLNYVELRAGEAVFVGAGVPHCYLTGFAAELMASSDNVLRAGLTSKRVNVPELLRVLDFRPSEPARLRPVPGGAAAPGGQSDDTSGANGTGRGPLAALAVYPAPVEDFQLSRLEVSDDAADLPGGRPQILLCTAGRARLTDAGGRVLELRRGQSAYLPAADQRTLVTGAGTILRATVGC